VKTQLKELVKLNLNIVKAYILKEQFHKFWKYNSPTWASKFLKNWIELVHESELQPMIKVTKTLENHHDLILNYFIAKKEFNSGIVEGLNRKVNLTVRKAFGYRSLDVMKTALYHQLGKLPEPQFDHDYW
jgi:transposase